VSELDDLRRALAQAIGERARAEAAAHALADVARSVSMSLDPDVVAHSTVDHVCRLVNVDVAVLFRLEPKSGDLISVAMSAGGAAVHEEPFVVPRGLGAAGTAAREGRPIMSADVVADPHLTLPHDLKHRLDRSGYRAVLAVPLRVGPHVVTGVLALNDLTGRHFAADEVALVQAFAGQAAVAFENARLHTETEERLRDTELLLTVSRAVSSTLDVTETMRRIAEAAGRMFGADMVGAYLADASADVLLPVAGYHVPRPLLQAFRTFPIPLRGHALLQEAWRTHRPVWSDDLEADARVDREAWRRFPHRSGLFVPMVVTGRPIGGLCLVWWEKRRTFRPAEIDLADGVARQAAIAIANSRSFHDADRRRREAEELAQVARLLTASLDAGTIARAVVDHVRMMFKADSTVLRSLRPDGALVEIARSGIPHPGHALEVVLSAGKGFAGRAVREGRTVQTADAPGEPELQEAGVYRETALARGIRGAVATPLRVKERIIGVLGLGFTAARTLTNAELTLLHAFADQAALALDNARLYQGEQETRASLRQLSQRLMEAQEAERRRLAFELHDEVGQSLTALKLNLELAEALASRPAAGKLVDCIQLADQVLKQVRGLSLDLRPSLLDDLGLSAAVRWYVAQQAERAGIVARVTAEIGEERLPAAIETACFRLVQEAVTNVLRHAHASRLFVDAHRREDRIELSIEDDGAGFDVAAARRGVYAGRSLGLLSMEERVSLVAGELVVDSAPGRGTRIHVSCPLVPAQPHPGP
jgi:signal transduction histidine kinase